MLWTNKSTYIMTQLLKAFSSDFFLTVRCCSGLWMLFLQCENTWFCSFTILWAQILHSSFHIEHSEHQKNCLKWTPKVISSSKKSPFPNPFMIQTFQIRCTSAQVEVAAQPQTRTSKSTVFGTAIYLIWAGKTCNKYKTRGLQWTHKDKMLRA